MLDDIPLPNITTDLSGHEQAELLFLDAYRSGRMHHAWLITGPQGIGKASFAFRAARFVLEHPDQNDPALAELGDLSVAPGSRAAAKVAAGAHPNLLHLKRPFDEKNKRLRAEIPVDEVRRTQAFFGTTAAERGWRICLIDCADDLNKNAANALLKTLEEPTDKGLYLIVCHNPGRILPTIRSRCRTLRLRGLSRPDLAATVRSVLERSGTQVPDADLETTLDTCQGSVGKALMLLMSGGVEVVHGFRAVAGSFPRIDRSSLHRFAQGLAARDAENQFELFCELAVELATDTIRLPDLPLGAKIRMADAGQSITDIARESRIFNLDRKQTVIRMVETLAEATVSPISHRSA